MKLIKSYSIYLTIIIVTSYLASCCCCVCPSGGARQVYYGMASYYGKDFHGKKTANGEIFNMYALTAAHKSLPFDTKVRVTNLQNNRSVVVRINDRGPFVKGRIIDLSYAAAQKIDMVAMGTVKVKIELLD